MFFTDPTAAFANVHRAMKPAGRLALAVLRPASENPWPTAPIAAVRHLLPPMPPPAPDEPGMFSWGDPARVQRILEGAGFRAVSLTPVNLDYQLAGAGGAAEAAEFSLLFGPLTRVPGLSAAQRDAVRSRLEGLRLLDRTGARLSAQPQRRSCYVLRTGSVKVKVEPTPNSLFTQIRPPCNSTNFRQRVSPSPVPSTFLSAVPTCRNSSNTAS